MDEILTSGRFTAQYINEPSEWRIFSQASSVPEAIIKPETWATEDVSFRSKEAGLLLLATINELQLGEEPDVEASMVKNDQGITKDVPTTELPETIIEEFTDNEDDDDLTSSLVELMHHILDKIEEDNGQDEENYEMLDDCKALLAEQLLKKAEKTEDKKILAELISQIEVLGC